MLLWSVGQLLGPQSVEAQGNGQTGQDCSWKQTAETMNRQREVDIQKNIFESSQLWLFSQMFYNLGGLYITI